MRTMTVLIPTRNRLEKLQRTLASIEPEEWLDTLVICDGDPKTFDALNGLRTDVRAILKPFRVGAVACRNSAMWHIEDGLLYATDDIVFFNGGVAEAYRQYNEHFPDDDGVLGLRQDKSHHPTGVAVVGRAFLNRYPDRQLFNPAYDHFACQEILWLAESLGKFKQSDRVLVEHFHPAFLKTEIDQTHHDARANKTADMELIENRKALHLVWGASQ